MEADPGKQRSRQKRRERALQLQQEKQTREEDEASGQDDQDESPPRSSKDKLPRSKPKKVKGALFEEDIIDGFAIMSFKTLEDLEGVSKKNGCIKPKAVKIEGDKPLDTLNHEEDNKLKKKKPKKPSVLNSCIENSNGDSGDVPPTASNSSNKTEPVVNHMVNSGDHLTNHHNGPLEPPRSISRDRLSDASTHSGSGQGYVCDVESGDDKASESGSDLYSGIPSGGILNDLPSNGISNPCVALTAPTPPPSTSSTPTSLCSPSPVHQVLVASTTTTTTTTTSSTSRPGLNDSLTALTAVTTATLSSVIHSAQSVPERSATKPPQNHLKRSLSPSSQQQHVGDNSSCARSIQYSKALKASSAHSSANKGLSHSHHQPSSDNPLQNGPGNLIQAPPAQPHLNNHFPYPSPGASYPSPYPLYSPLRPDPRPVALGSSPRPDQRCNSLTPLSNGTPVTTTPSHLGRSDQNSSGHSSPGYQHKTPPTPSWTNDPRQKFTPPLPPKSQSCKPEQLTFSASSLVKDSDKDKIKHKDSSGHHLHHSHHHHHSKDREKEREKQRTPVSSSSLTCPTYPTAKPTWPSQVYSPLLHHHSPLTPAPPQSSPLFPLPLAPPPPLLAAGPSSLSAGMFAPPIPPAPPTLSSAPLPTHPTASSQFSAESLIRSPDFLHQDLNNRLLAHRESSSIALPPTQFVRSETHQHQHQHQHLHNHMHQHTYGGLSASPLVPPGPPLFEKMPKMFETAVFRPSIVPSYSSFSSLLPPGPSGSTIASSLQGAFQPKSLVTPGQMLVPFRDREKAVPPPPTPKKQGKWCAVHVRVAWEIYHRQQKQPDPGSSNKSDSKPLEPSLRPPAHLLPPSRPTDLGPSTPTSLLASVARSVPEGIVHPSSSFLSSNLVSGMSGFPRPSPYPPPSLLNPLSFSGLGSSMFSPVRDMGPPGLPSGLSSPHEWNRLHRTPSSFPSWPKSEQDREKERDKERKDDERERRSLNHRLPGTEDPRHSDPSRPRSRSRSRSPLRNGRLECHVKPEMGHYDRRPLSASSSDRRPLSASSSGMKLKEEENSIPHHIVEREKMERERMERERMERERLERDRLERDRLERDRLERDRIERDRMERDRMEKEKLLQNAERAEREKILQAVEQREKFLQNSYLSLSPFHTHPGLLDRRVSFMAPPGYPFLDRPPVPTTMWNPFDKTSLEMAHRLEIERERERMSMVSRLSSIPSHLAALEQERLKEQIVREQQEREYDLRRQYLERLPAFTADRLRAADPLALSGYFPRTISPMFGPGSLAGLKSNSPHMPGVPPPLIPSSSSTSMLSSRSHDNSPSSSSKSKGCSPADSTSDLKDKGNSTDPDAHSR
ncbi:fibrosin-1-like protein isoform X2 [Physella acuta]|uniref:fibrosin-1-like protein isoform X2 n=1 Tax=Physella acuta TaxID=109671 RepID=UPI0027DCD67E|nr:fibrosin-1-like protein isoform X2 [Physella acuta]